MGVTFNTPVAKNLTNSISSVALAMTGVTSGQPIVLFVLGYRTSGAPTAPTVITDTFSTAYVWTNVTAWNGLSSGPWLSIWIGTGGSGASGTITITVSNVSSEYFGGVAASCIGASQAAGLSAVDQSNFQTESLVTALTVDALTPSEGGEGAAFLVFTSAATITSGPASPWATATQILFSGGYSSGFTTQGSPATGTGLSGSFALSTSANGIVGTLLILPGVTFVAKKSLTASQAVKRASYH